MELGKLNKLNIGSVLTGTSFIIGFVHLILLNLTIMTDRNLLPTGALALLLIAVLTGIAALFLKTSNKLFTILSLIINLLTIITFLVVILMGYSINPSP